MNGLQTAEPMGVPTGEPTHGKLGSYRLLSLLGRGGMGEVFLAWDDRLERHVAVKRVLSDPPPTEQAKARFRREARAAARLSHPAIVQVYELLELDDGDCLVMEYVEGQSLRQLLADGPLDIDTALRLTAEIADGLAEAHGKGLIHRDLKPDNVRITAVQGEASEVASAGRASAGRAKILDFGLARLLWNEEADGTSLEETLTRSGALVGTVHAMSPEQASGRPVDHRSDLFALGGLLYEMLSGRAPFLGSNTLDTLRRVHSETPVPLDELRLGLPTELAELVEALLAKDPNRRPQNARLVADALQEMRSNLATPITSNEGVGAAQAPIRPPMEPRRIEVDADLMDQPTGEFPAPVDPSTAVDIAVRTLLLTDLVGSTQFVESLGDVRAAEILARHDRMARDLLTRHDGLEIDKSDGFFLLFERPLAAVAYALAYHRSLQTLANELDVELTARAGLHLGEVVLRRNRPDDVARGAKPIEVEGLAKPMASRLMSLASGRQTLLTQSVFDLTRRAAVDDERWDAGLSWLAHGPYLFQGLDETVEVFEVGIRDVAPLAAPADSDKAQRAVPLSAEHVLGWRPAPGQTIPLRPKWQLEERLGEGGFGEVWRAAHPSGEQRVFKFCFEADKLRALKREVTLFRLLKGTLGHRDDIARILDWNFETAPYFLEAEHTEGGDLTDWVVEQGGFDAVPLDTRVELVAQVADALAAAHSVGVLHKDVKPENVLIHQGVDGRPRSRLTDFGVGMLVDRSQLDSRDVTALGFTATLTESASTAGSRRYLAPELLEGKPASVQADLYSVGVFLYQMATGDFGRALAPGWQRDVPDDLLVEDIADLVDGSPQRRPSGAGEVAQKLRRLETRRFERARLQQADRRRRRFCLAAMVGGVLLVMVSGLLVQAELARREAERLQGQAEVAREQAEGLIGFMLGDLQNKLQAIGRLDALEGAGQKALEYFDGLEEGDLSSQTVARHAKALHQMGDVKMAQGDLEGALQLFERSLAQTQELVARDPDDVEALFELGQSHFWVASIHWRRGDLEPALANAQGYLSFSQELLEHDEDRPEWLLEVAYAYTNLADIYMERNDADLAIAHLTGSLTLSQRLVELDPSQTQWRYLRASVHLRLGLLNYRIGQFEESSRQDTEAVAVLEQLVAEDAAQSRWQRELGLAHLNLAERRLALGDLEGALHQRQSGLAILERLHALEPDSEEWRILTGLAQAELGHLLTFDGQARLGMQTTRRALDLFAESSADIASLERRQYHAKALTILSDQLFKEGRLDEAERSSRRALSVLGDDRDRPRLHLIDPAIGAKLQLARVLWAKGEHTEAKELAERAKAALLSQETLDVPRRWHLAVAHQLLGEKAEARDVYRSLLAAGFREPDMVAESAQLDWNQPS